MKKIPFFSLFLLIFSFLVVFFNAPTHAEIEGYEFSVKCEIYSPLNSDYIASENFNQQTNTLTCDYADIETNGNILFSINNYNSQHQEGQFSYIWKTTSGDTISSSNELIIYKNLLSNNPNAPIIKHGETRYVLTVKETQTGNTKDIVVRLVITDTTSSVKMQTVSTEIPAHVTDTNANITFQATIPTLQKNNIVWYLKAPNQTTFKPISNGNTYIFAPSETINFKNGYGVYKIMAIGTTANQTYYSKTYLINGEAQVITIGEGIYNIKVNKVTNTKTSIQAFKYSINNPENMITDNICWYVNGIKIANGESFVYEPTTTDEYKVVAKYNGQQLASVIEVPEPTNTYVLFIIIGVGVLILTIILISSIKISNKKRDVVW